MSPVSLPAFDPQSPDAAILAAFETVRSSRAFEYEFDDQAVTPEIEAEIDASQGEAMRAESLVDGNFATTAAGIYCKLALHITSQADRWIDSDFMRFGFRALYAQRSKLDGEQTRILEAMHELLHLEFATAFTDARRRVTDYAMICRIKTCAEEEMYRLRRGEATSPGFIDRLMPEIEKLEERLSDAGSLARLQCALAPDRESFARKTALMVEADDEIPTHFVARDAAFLAGDK